MLDKLETPSLILDADKLDRNCARMRERLATHGVTLRPHVKTAKNVEVAQCALGAETGPITVSTLREAEYFFDHGFRDILYAVGMVPLQIAVIGNNSCGAGRGSPRRCAEAEKRRRAAGATTRMCLRHRSFCAPAP